MGTTLVINPGSSSRKYALYNDGLPVLEIKFENTNTGHEVCSQVSGGQQKCESINKEDFFNSVEKVAEEVDRYIFRESLPRLDSIVVRVVAPGTFFQSHAPITDEYIDKLKKKENVAPLHITYILKEITSIRKLFKQAKLYAASDSAFHSQMPRKAREYSISLDDSNTYDIHRFGYHGLSVASIVRKIHPLIGIDPEKMIVCHIGSGVSVTAVKKGVGFETSMGFSPTSGLLMGSRAGDLDATALIELIRAKNWRAKDAEVYLSTRGGFVGIANEADIRKLLDRRSQKDDLATLALDMFAYGLQKEIAAQTVALEGLDVLVLTATAAVRSSELRSLVLAKIKHLGVLISEDRNNSLMSQDGVISVRNSPVKVVVMRTDEMGEMATIPKMFQIDSRKRKS